MTKIPRPSTHSRAPNWTDWLLPAATSVTAIVLLAACFGWWSAQSARDTARAATRDRLGSIARAVGVFASDETVGPGVVERYLAQIGPREGLVSAERLEQGDTPHHPNPDIVSVTAPLPRELGVVHLVGVIEQESPANTLLLPGVVSIGLAVLVTLASLTAARRTAGLRRVGSALRAINGGEKDSEILLVAERFGPDAQAWNALLATLRNVEQSPAASPANRRDSSAEAGALPGGALDAMPFGLIALDHDASVMFCNGAASVMLGVNRVELVGQTIDGHKSFADMADAIRTVASGGTPRTTLDIFRGEETRRDVFRVTVRSLRKDDDATVLIILEDVTQTRLADEARNGFVAQATHELRTPLTNIRLLVEEAIENGVADSQALAHSLNIVNEEARRLDRVVTDMLSVSEIEAATLTLHIDDTPLVKLFNDLEMDYRAQAGEKSIDLAFTLPAKLEPINADREKLALLLHNVLGNAVKYTPAGGRVEVTAEQDDAGLTVSVRDNGPGIAAEDHDRVFQKFYRTDDARVSDTKGSGLGLALAREIARLHGGDINIESELGHGSTFTVRVPCHGAAAVSRAA